MKKFELEYEDIDEIHDLLDKHDQDGLDWTCAAQSVAMARGYNEKEFLDAVRKYFK